VPNSARRSGRCARNAIPTERQHVQQAPLHGQGPHHGRARGRRLPQLGRPADSHISPPGGHGTGTNPEQLFAAGWSTCFTSAIHIAAHRRKAALPPDFAIDAEVDLSLVEGAYTLSARLNVSLPGLAREVAQALADEAHTLCPYSRATHGNIDVTTNLAV
jgi:osmotically inducible protein OsmC